MAMKRPVSLGPAQETLLIPLYGRAEFTRQGSPLISDPLAVRMVEAIDYDFAKFDGIPSLLGAVTRTRVFDIWVERWLAEHPGGTVVEVGAGLNTRFERLDNGRVRWIDLDLPDAVELRRRFFSETENRRMLEGSVAEPDWVAPVSSSTGPWFFAIEAVLIYLRPDEVRRALGLIAEHFPGAHVAFDTYSEWIRDHQDEHDALQLMDARVTWFCDDPVTIESWGLGLRLLESRSLPEAPPELLDLLPPEVQGILPILAEEPEVQAYKLNLFEMAGK